MEAIAIGVINLILLIGKILWDVWLGKKVKEAENRKREQEDRDLQEEVRRRIEEHARDDNAGIPALEDRFDEWKNRPVDK